MRIETQDLVKLAGLDWGVDSFLLEDLRTGTSTFFPAKTWLTKTKKTANIYADKDTPPLRARLQVYSQLVRNIPKLQPDSTWDSISKRRRLNQASNNTKVAGGLMSFGIRCIDLPNLDVLSASDPMVVVTMKTGLSTWQELYRTEVVENCNQPVFKKKKEIHFIREAVTWIKFSVYDVDDCDGVLISAQDFCGSATVTMQALAETGSLGRECKFPLFRGEDPFGAIIIFDLEVKENLQSSVLAAAPVYVRDVRRWLDDPQAYISDIARSCQDSAAVLKAIGAQSCDEILATFSISEEYTSEQARETCMLTSPAFKLMQSDPFGALNFYNICRKTSKALKKLRAQVSDGLISLAITELHEIELEINAVICFSGFPSEFDLVCMKYKTQLESFCVLCSYAAKADLHSRLQFQIKVTCSYLQESNL